MSTSPSVSCEGGGRSVSRRNGAGAMEWVVAAAACEKVNIEGDGTFAVSAAAAC